MFSFPQDLGVPGDEAHPVMRQGQSLGNQDELTHGKIAVAAYYKHFT